MSSFRCKEFAIFQDRCAMKVSQDACLFGAWAANHFTFSRALDIGTGTGLLSLMLAQKHNQPIDAVEIEPAAAQQATENIKASKWATQIKVFNQSIQTFAQEQQATYDLIVSNPPFFVNALKSTLSEQKNLARHADALPYPTLLEVVYQLLMPQGTFAVLLPTTESKQFENQVVGNLFVSRRCLVCSLKGKTPHRVLLAFQKQPTAKPTNEEIIVRDAHNAYTNEFKALLNDYYL